ncbi:MAG: nucleotide-binding protein [Thiobacillus sp.]|nr:nucleotide-binding protein [Thiobacillus sp.]
MKKLLALCLFVVATPVWSGDVPQAAVVKGEVLEIKEVASYTYLRLKTKNGETWAAVSKAPVAKGAQVTIENPMVMNNFQSKSLNKTFPEIIFGNLAGTGGGGPMASQEMARAHAGLSVKADAGAAIQVAKASGPNARTVAEIIAGQAKLKDKPVVLRAKVVKFNAQIMGRNWVHVRDGSGSAEAGSNDLLVTTKAMAKVGDVVTVKGVVRVDKDFGSGYAYKVLVEDATLQP